MYYVCVFYGCQLGEIKIYIVYVNFSSMFVHWIVFDTSAV